MCRRSEADLPPMKFLLTTDHPMFRDGPGAGDLDAVALILQKRDRARHDPNWAIPAR